MPTPRPSIPAGSKLPRKRWRAPLLRSPLAPAALAFGCGAGTAPLDPIVYPAALVQTDGCAPAFTRIEHLDEPTPLGFSAIDVLGRLAGPRSSPLFWLEPASNPEYLLGLGPEQGRSSLALDLRAQEGPIYPSTASSNASW